jgi:hypothetical protein
MSATRREFVKAARAEVLGELIAAGLPADTVVQFPAPGVLWVWCDDAHLATAAAVVAAHDPSIYAAAEAQEQTRFQQDVANIKTFMATANTSVSLLALVAIVKAIVRVLWRVVRELRDD